MDDNVITDYYFEMARRERLLLVTNESGQVVGVLTFFLLPTRRQAHAFHRLKKDWEAPPDTETGPIAYIDHLYSTIWNKDIRESVEACLVHKYPCVKLGVWYRQQGKRDRPVVIPVRRRS